MRTRAPTTHCVCVCVCQVATNSRICFCIRYLPILICLKICLITCNWHKATSHTKCGSDRTEFIFNKNNFYYFFVNRLFFIRSLFCFYFIAVFGCSLFLISRCAIRCLSLSTIHLSQLTHPHSSQMKISTIHRSPYLRYNRIQQVPLTLYI